MLGSGKTADLGPDAAGRQSDFGFARDASAVPFAEGDETLATEAAFAGDAAAVVDVDRSLRQMPSQDFLNILGHPGATIHLTFELLPEATRILEDFARHLAQLFVLLGKDEWLDALLEPIDVALENRLARLADFDVEVVDADGELGAGGQTHEVDGVRERIRLVEVVDTPDETPFFIAPDPVVLEVEIDDRVDDRC